MIAPIKEILPNRDENLQKILDAFSDHIDEAASFGTHILKWDVEVVRSGKDNNIPSIFLRNIIELADSISILIRNSSVDPAKIIFRSLVESCFSLNYMLKEDQKQRALCFIVCKSILKIKQCNKWITSEYAHKEFIKNINADNLDADLTAYFDHPEFIRVKKQKEILINKPEFKKIYDEYRKTKQKLNVAPNWYSLFDGPKNFRELAIHLNKALRYEFYYKTFSDNVHGTSVEKGFASAGGGRAQIIQIRDFENVQELFSNSVAILLELYIVFIRQRISDKENVFKNWFEPFNKGYQNLTKQNLINYKK